MRIRYWVISAPLGPDPRIGPTELRHARAAGIDRPRQDFLRPSAAPVSTGWDGPRRVRGPRSDTPGRNSCESEPDERVAREERNVTAASGGRRLAKETTCFPTDPD